MELTITARGGYGVLTRILAIVDGAAGISGNLVISGSIVNGHGAVVETLDGDGVHKREDFTIAETLGADEGASEPA